MSYYIYVDNSNVWIEGQRVSAVRKGIDGISTLAESFRDGVVDGSWRFNFGKLKYFAGGDEVAMARLYGSRPPASDALWDRARRCGFDVKVFDRSFGKEKRVDTQMVADVMEDLYERIDPKSDVVVIVAGDQDHMPVLEKAKAKGVRVEVVFWSHANHHLRNEADEFIELDPHFDHLTL